MDDSVTVVSSRDAIYAMTTGEVDSQVATAKRYPRNMEKFRKTVKDAVTRDHDTAGSMFYSLERKNKDGEKVEIEGPSIRLAEIMFSNYQNLRGEKVIESIDERTVTAVGTVYDIENNTIFRVKVKRPIVTRNGARYGDDMIKNTGAAAASIAFRDAMFTVIPQAETDAFYEAARKMYLEGAKDIPSTFASAVKWFGKLGVTQAMILKKLDITKVEEVTGEHLLKLKGFQNSLKEKEAKIGDIFGDDPKTTENKAETILKEMQEKKAATEVDTQSGNGSANIPTVQEGEEQRK